MTWYFKFDTNPGATLLSGMVTTSTASTTVTGTGTSFLTDFKQDDTIGVTNGSAIDLMTVASVASNVSLTLTANASHTLTAVTYGNRTPQTFMRSTFWPAAGAGTVATTSGSAVITGTGTTFTQYFSAGAYIVVTGGDTLRIHSVDSDTQVTATSNASTTVSGAAYQYKALIQYAGKTPPFLAPSNVSVPSPSQSGPDITEYSITNRYVLDQLGLAKGATRDIFAYYTDANAYVWGAYPDEYDTLIQPQLSTTESASRTQSSTGLTLRSYRSEFTPDFTRRNIFTVGDSITQGLNFGAANDTQTYQYQMALLLKNYRAPIYDGTVSNVALIPSNSQGQQFYDTNQFCIRNIGQGSASWMNTNPSSSHPIDWTHHWNEMLYQKVNTLPNPPAGNPYFILFWVGTNDAAYDSGVQTGTSLWARATTGAGIVRTRFNSSQAIMIIGTSIGRSSTTSLNTLLDNYNNQIRSNYASVGFNGLADIERNTVDNSGTQAGYSNPYVPYKCVTDGFGSASERSSTTNPYYWDSNTSSWVHPSAYGYTLIAQVWAAAVNKFL